MSIIEKYRPKLLSDIWGQADIVESLKAFVADPSPRAFIFAGGTGVGKTSAALCLARELGCGLDSDGELDLMGGFSQIASGDQLGDNVREALRGLWLRPMKGSGWKVLVVNEADYMSQSAAQVWLDGLENLPPRSVIIFTTNKLDKLPRRFRDRCESFVFESGALLLMPEAQAFAAKVWRDEGRTDPCPDVATLDLVDEAGDLSFRRLLQAMNREIRNKSPFSLDYIRPDSTFTTVLDGNNNAGCGMGFREAMVREVELLPKATAAPAKRRSSKRWIPGEELIPEKAARIVGRRFVRDGVQFVITKYWNIRCKTPNMCWDNLLATDASGNVKEFNRLIASSILRSIGANFG